MKKPNIRQNFYQGQNVLANNLNTLQDYSDTNSNLLVSELLGSGIVDGFEITHKGGFTVSITKGVAFDKNGNRLILEKDTDVPLTTPTTTGIDKRMRPILLGVKYFYIESELVKDSQDRNTPTILTPSVEFVMGETLDENVFLLAVITLGEKAIIDIDNKAKKIMTLEQQVSKTNAFTTTTNHGDTIANIDADIFNINKKSFTDTIRDMVYPIGYQYTQYPNDTTGVFDETETPLALFGGDWEKQFETESVFFRTEGSLANESRSAGLQLDAMQLITGKFSPGMKHPNSSGVFTSSYDRSLESGSSIGGFSISFNNARQARTSQTENRSRNRLMIIWKRIG